MVRMLDDYGADGNSARRGDRSLELVFRGILDRVAAGGGGGAVAAAVGDAASGGVTDDDDDYEDEDEDDEDDDEDEDEDCTDSKQEDETDGSDIDYELDSEYMGPGYIPPRSSSVSSRARGAARAATAAAAAATRAASRAPAGEASVAPALWFRCSVADKPPQAAAALLRRFFERRTVARLVTLEVESSLARRIWASASRRLRWRQLSDWMPRLLRALAAPLAEPPSAARPPQSPQSPTFDLEIAPASAVAEAAEALLAAARDVGAGVEGEEEPEPELRRLERRGSSWGSEEDGRSH